MHSRAALGASSSSLKSGHAGEELIASVSRTFHEHEILVTGANGFLGKTLLALLLDRYPQFRHVHILLRPGKAGSAEHRFWNETAASPPLAPTITRTGKEALQTKISVWQGDIGAPQCGLSGEAVERLRGAAGLIINCAGKVDFLPPVDEAFRSNVDGIENVAALAQQIGAKLLHVSTCYVCGEADGLIEETEPILGFYPQRRGPGDSTFQHAEELLHARKLIRQIYEPAGVEGPAAGRRPREITQRLTALGRQRAASWGWANTYTYSKSLGEQIISSTAGLEYSIVRPSIVESAWRFPFCGWSEGGRTAAPLVLMALDGLRDWPVREDAPLEVVPVDMVAAAILVVAHALLHGLHESVYQLGSADTNPITLGSVVALLHEEAKVRAKRDGNASYARVPLDWLAGRWRRSRMRFLSADEVQERQQKLQQKIARTERWLGGMKEVLRRTALPGQRLLDNWSTELRKMDLQAKFRQQTLDQYLPFVLHNRYVFESENIRVAYAALAEPDRQLLPWTPERIDWKDYWINNQIGGIEKWVQPEAVRDWTFKV